MGIFTVIPALICCVAKSKTSLASLLTDSQMQVYKVQTSGQKANIANLSLLN